ncbi:MAG: alcohol dehydrogenase catalytic domain-containing protein, partial [Desulfobulbia bacterium]
CENFRGYVGREIDGAYAEYVKLPAENFVPLPESLDYKRHPAEIGVIADAIATPVKVVRHAQIKPGETVAVIGAGGGLGIHMVMVASWANARVIAVDRDATKLEICKKHGAEFSIGEKKQDLGDALTDLTEGKGVDVVVDFVCTNDTIENTINALGPGGRLVLLGGAGKTTPFEGYVDTIKNNELSIIGSRYATRSEVRQALELVGRGVIWPLVSETYPLMEAEQVHRRLEESLITGRAALLM